MDKLTLLKQYRAKRPAIKNRLSEFKKTGRGSDRRIFEELAFCILTPQSKAVLCDKAIKGLTKSGALFKGRRGQIRRGLRGVRFPNQKTRFLFEARRPFEKDGKLKIKQNLNPLDVFATRDWLVKSVKGLGYKEASHFLRNIGLGCDLAILDVHILRLAKRLGIIKSIPKSLSKKQYLDIEEKIRQFSAKVKIPMAELDLLFWSGETGYIFK